MTGRVEGKVALVTGAARGQGRSHAVNLAAEGADIIAVDICRTLPGLRYELGTAEDLAETAELVKATGGRIVCREADTRDVPALAAAIDAGVAEFGRLDVVVANAAISYIATWDDVTEAMWDDTLGVNLTGTWNTLRLSAPHLIAAGGGSIIVTSSTAGLVAMPWLTPYVASKFAVTGLARAFAIELGKHNIRVNTIHPTGVDTPMGGGAAGAAAVADLIDADPKLASAFAHMLPVEIVDPQDISNAVLYLASDESRYVSALALSVDAGLTQF